MLMIRNLNLISVQSWTFLHFRPIESSSHKIAHWLKTHTYLDSNLEFFFCMNSIFGNDNLDQGIVGQGKAC